MPDLPNRQDEEAALAALLLVQFEEFQDEALGLLGDPPDMANLPVGYFDRIAQSIKATLLDQLTGLHVEAAERMAEAFDMAWDAARAAKEAAAWAEQRATELATDFAKRIYEQISEALQRFREQENSDAAAAGLGVMLATIFSEERAEGIAVTETTGAVSEGEIAEARRMERELGVKIVAEWVTERDARVCPICTPLDGQPEEDWREQFPSGPPAHPRCRCYLTWNVGGLAEPSAN